MKFSERVGVTPVPNILQTNSISADLRNSLWNTVLRTVFNVTDQYHSIVTKHLAEYFYKIPVDTLPPFSNQQISWFRDRFYHRSVTWWQIYNLVEFLSDNCGVGKTIDWVIRNDFITAVNVVLETEMSGFRFVNGILAPITSEVELQAIQQAAGEAQQRGFSGTQQHIACAVQLLSQKPIPDYRNSIKESISAVESISKQITGQSSGGLDNALSRLDTAVHFHGAFKSGLLSLYGYTSDDSGIRHAILDEPSVGFDEAKFMLVICSALVNFIMMKATQAGITTNALPV